MRLLARSIPRSWHSSEAVICLKDILEAKVMVMSHERAKTNPSGDRAAIVRGSAFANGASLSPAERCIAPVYAPLDCSLHRTIKDIWRAHAVWVTDSIPPRCARLSRARIVPSAKPPRVITRIHSVECAVRAASWSSHIHDGRSVLSYFIESG